MKYRSIPRREGITRACGPFYFVSTVKPCPIVAAFISDGTAKRFFSGHFIILIF